MVGVVKAVAQETGLIVVETEDSFTVFETESADDVEAGDVIEGDLVSPTCDSVVNHSKDGEMDVYVRDIVNTLAAAEALLGGE
jgi:hypothetical protein